LQYDINTTTKVYNHSNINLAVSEFCIQTVDLLTHTSIFGIGGPISDRLTFLKHPDCVKSHMPKFQQQFPESMRPVTSWHHYTNVNLFRHGLLNEVFMWRLKKWWVVNSGSKETSKEAVVA